jgi:hypothetical protein
MPWRKVVRETEVDQQMKWGSIQGMHTGTLQSNHTEVLKTFINTL